MRLLLDAGNTRIKWALQTDAGLVEMGACPHSDWETKGPASLLRQHPVDIWAGSVASAELNRRLRELCIRKWNLEPRFAHSSASACGLSNAYAEPEKLGVDRWLACIGAFEPGAGSVLVVDAGTALTLDFVDSQGRHQGGLIAPGVATMRAALRAGTQLRPQAAGVAGRWLGLNTDEAVSLGSLQAAIALATETARRFEPDRRVLTGGEAGLLADSLPGHWFIEDQLVLRGLARLAAESD